MFDPNFHCDKVVFKTSVVIRRVRHEHHQFAEPQVIPASLQSQMIHTSGTTMCPESCACTTSLLLPAVRLCLIHTHTCTDRTAHIRSWTPLIGELWPYLELPADLFVLANGLSNKWSPDPIHKLTALSDNSVNWAPRTWPLPHRRSASHPVTRSAIQSRCAWLHRAHSFLYCLKSISSEVDFTKKKKRNPEWANGQLRQTALFLFSLNSVAFWKSNVALGYFRASLRQLLS